MRTHVYEVAINFFAHVNCVFISHFIFNQVMSILSRLLQAEPSQSDVPYSITFEVLPGGRQHLYIYRINIGSQNLYVSLFSLMFRGLEHNSFRLFPFLCYEDASKLFHVHICFLSFSLNWKTTCAQPKCLTVLKENYPSTAIVSVNELRF